MKKLLFHNKKIAENGYSYEVNPKRNVYRFYIMLGNYTDRNVVCLTQYSVYWDYNFTMFYN